MRRLILLLSVLTSFRLEASRFVYHSDSSLEDVPPLLLSTIRLDDDSSPISGDKLTIIEDNIQVSRAYVDRTPDSQVSSLTSSSPEVTKFTIYNDERNRPRGSSFNSHTHSTPKHVSFGWVQFSDDRWMPSEEMEDSKENRKHILTLMLADAKHGNLEYFKYLAEKMQMFEAKNPSIVSKEDELSFYNPESLIFAAVHSDNVELFCEVMKLKGLTFEDLNPFHHLKQKKKSPKIDFIPGSFPPRKKSVFDSFDSDDDEDNGDELLNAEETVFGQAVIHNSIALVNFLIETGGMRDEYPDKTCTFLHLAVKNGHELLVKTLLEHGGSQIDRVDGALMSPLLIAIKLNYRKIVKLLLVSGASLFVTDFHQKNCFHYAVETGNLKILDIVIDASKKLTSNSRNMLFNSKDVFRMTPLQYANDIVYEHIKDEFK